MPRFPCATHGAHVTYAIPSAQAEALTAMLCACAADTRAQATEPRDAYRHATVSGCTAPLRDLALFAPEPGVLRAVLPALRARAALSNTPLPMEWVLAAARASHADAPAAQVAALSPALATLANIVFASLRLVLITPDGTVTVAAPGDPARFPASVTIFLLQHLPSAMAPPSTHAFVSLVAFGSLRLDPHARVPFLSDAEWRLAAHE